MRSLLAASALSALLLAPVVAQAAPPAASAAGQQVTGTEQEFRQSVKHRRPTYMRHQISRAERNKNKPNVVR